MNVGNPPHTAALHRLSGVSPLDDAEFRAANGIGAAGSVGGADGAPEHAGGQAEFSRQSVTHIRGQLLGHATFDEPA